MKHPLVRRAVVLAGWAATGMVASADPIAGETVSKSDSAGEVIRTSPFQAQRANYFHAALGVPRLDTAELLPPGSMYIRLRTDHSHSELGPRVSGHDLKSAVASGGRPEDSFLGRFHQWLSLEVSGGVSDWLELRGRLAYGGWDEHYDHFYFFADDGTPLVEGEDRNVFSKGATSRQADVADAVMEAKIRVGQGELGSGRYVLSAAPSVKLPLASANNLVDAGTTDAGLRLLAGYFQPSFALHLNAGGVVPLGDQNLFVDSQDIELDPIFVWGLGADWLPSPVWTFGVQLEGNTGAFSDVPFLDGDPLTALIGVRRRIHNTFIEAGYGRGFDPDVSYEWSGFFSVGTILD